MAFANVTVCFSPFFRFIFNFRIDTAQKTRFISSDKRNVTKLAVSVLIIALNFVAIVHDVCDDQTRVRKLKKKNKQKITSTTQNENKNVTKQIKQKQKRMRRGNFVI